MRGVEARSIIHEIVNELKNTLLKFLDNPYEMLFI
jgi:hypothetical protein